ncbi:LysE family transporter [uncultured Roseobacter sp.]|uniref:LysE family translocator n=1 Tax=uncultured Roseobacter sp. TaxID=114847 RepID=UPI002603B1B4|nr:LysE family transporter [uncultured Roseobacter sp.]
MTVAALTHLMLLQVLIAMSPGPAVVLTIRTAASKGARAALKISLGLALGILLWAIAALAGLAVLFEVMPWIQTGLRLIGAAFLVWIGIRLWRDASHPLAEIGTELAPQGYSGVGLGVWTNLANPKALAYFAAVFTGILPVNVTFADAAAILAVVFIVEAAWYTSVALVFSRPAPRQIYARVKAGLERFFGALIAAFGLRLLFERT